MPDTKKKEPELKCGSCGFFTDDPHDTEDGAIDATEPLATPTERR